MRKMRVNKVSFRELMYEPQLARDLKNTGARLVKIRSEAAGEISRSDIKVWHDEDDVFGTGVSIPYPDAVGKYLALMSGGAN